MLVGLLNLIFNIAIFLVSLAGWLLLIYVVMSWIIPQNKYTLLVGKYVEPMLAPVCALLARLIPPLANSRLDFSPVALWLLLEIAGWLLGLLRNILL